MTSFFKSMGAAAFLSVMSLSACASQDMADATTKELATVEEAELSQDLSMDSNELETATLDEEAATDEAVADDMPSDEVEVCYTENGEEVPCEEPTN